MLCCVHQEGGRDQGVDAKWGRSLIVGGFEPKTFTFKCHDLICYFQAMQTLPYLPSWHRSHYMSLLMPHTHSGTTYYMYQFGPPSPPRVWGKISYASAPVMGFAQNIQPPVSPRLISPSTTSRPKSIKREEISNLPVTTCRLNLINVVGQRQENTQPVSLLIAVLWDLEFLVLLNVVITFPFLRVEPSVETICTSRGQWNRKGEQISSGWRGI